VATRAIILEKRFTGIGGGSSDRISYKKKRAKRY